MKKYITSTTIQAKPMNHKEALKMGLKINKVCGDGFYILDEKGNESWLPEDLFQKKYKAAETYIDRLYIERDELQEKIEKLSRFLKTNLEIRRDEESFSLLHRQILFMEEYLDTLNKRIKLTLQ